MAGAEGFLQREKGCVPPLQRRREWFYNSSEEAAKEETAQ